jgi:pimeloyl-ACP methyl ester carboxylesterase
MTSGDAPTKPAVLVLTGVGLTAAIARRLVDPLQAYFRVLSATLSAAGAGTLADDAVALLDRAGVDQAHVVGLSFGGVIAQDIAIRYPRRVRALVLGSSSGGGNLYVPPSRAIRQFVRRLSDLPAEEGLWAAVPYLYAETTYRRCARLIGEDIAHRLSGSLDPRLYRHQHAIARAHDTGARLGEITAPTLVIHGEQDRLLPVDNGRLLAGGIGGAQLMSVPGGAHAFPTDVPDASLGIVNFLRAHSRRPADPAPPTGRAGTHKARATRA